MNWIEKGYILLEREFKHASKSVLQLANYLLVVRLTRSKSNRFGNFNIYILRTHFWGKCIVQEKSRIYMVEKCCCIMFELFQNSCFFKIELYNIFLEMYRFSLNPLNSKLAYIYQDQQLFNNYGIIREVLKK